MKPKLTFWLVALFSITVPGLIFAQIKDNQAFKNSKRDLRVTDVKNDQVKIELILGPGGIAKEYTLYGDDIKTSKNCRLSYKDGDQMIIAYYVEQSTVEQNRAVMIIFRSSGNPCHPEDDILESFGSP